MVAWSGANMQPKQESTTSNASSSNGSASASPSTQSTVDAGGGGAGARGREVLGRDVDAGDLGARLRGGDGDVAGAARDVEDAVAGPDADARHQALADLRDDGRERGVVAGRPPRACGLRACSSIMGGTLADPAAAAFASTGHPARSGPMA